VCTCGECYYSRMIAMKMSPNDLFTTHLVTKTKPEGVMSKNATLKCFNHQNYRRIERLKGEGMDKNILLFQLVDFGSNTAELIL